jgi:hypothetical protein
LKEFLANRENVLGIRKSGVKIQKTEFSKAFGKFKSILGLAAKNFLNQFRFIGIYTYTILNTSESHPSQGLSKYISLLADSNAMPLSL